MWLLFYRFVKDIRLCHEIENCFQLGRGHEVAWIAHTECEIADCKTSELLHWTYLMQVHQICHGINVCVQRDNSHC